MIETRHWKCALCGGECFGNRFGLCTNCLHTWTATGTFQIPEWLRIFSREHHRYEQRMVHQEIPFAHAFPETGEYDGVYTEVRYEIIEEKFHKHKTRGRPRKLINKK